MDYKVWEVDYLVWIYDNRPLEQLDWDPMEYHWNIPNQKNYFFLLNHHALPTREWDRYGSTVVIGSSKGNPSRSKGNHGTLGSPHRLPS